MPVNLFGKLRKAFSGSGGIADASDIETTGNSNAQTDLNNLSSSILSWKFSSSIDGTNPGATFLALNNAVKDNATVISFNTTSNIDSARFDEALQRLNVNDGIFLQERTAINNSIFYRVTGAPTVDGTRVDVPVARERDQGVEFTPNSVLNTTFFFKGAATPLDAESVRDIVAAFLVQGTDVTIVHDDVADTLTISSTASGGGGLTEEQIRDLVATFLVQGTNISLVHDDAADTLTISATGAAGGLDAEQVRDTVAAFATQGSNITITHDDVANTLTFALSLGNSDLLADFTESDSRSFVNKIDTEAVVRFWLRTNFVNSGNINNPGEGLIISEANGDLSSENDTYQDDANHFNQYLYMSLNDSYISTADLTTHYVVIKDSDGTIRQTLNVSTDFMNEGKFGIGGSNTFFRMIQGGLGGVFPQYRADQTIELFTETIDQFFEIPAVSADDIDVTRGVKNLPESALDAETQSKLNTSDSIPHDDQFKLDQLVEISETSASGVLSGSQALYWTFHEFSENINDYSVSDLDTGIPPNLADSTRNYIVALRHDYTITSFTGLESGTATVTEIKADILLANSTDIFNVYRVAVPSTASATNFFLANGTQVTISEIRPNSLFKIDRDNVQADFLSHIENTQSSSIDNERLTALENKVSTLYALAPDIDALLNWGDIYIPERAQQEVVLTEGYDLVADYRGPSTRYESSGVVYSDAGTNVVTYTGLTTSIQRIFGFKVPSASNQTLLWIISGSERIPFIDMTSSGNYRVNNYQQSRTASDPVSNEIIFLSLISGGTNIMTISQNAVFVINDYPTGATDTSRSVQVGFDVLIGGVDTQGEHIQNFNVPETNTPQDRIDTTVNINLGPLHPDNRIITVEIGYRFTLVGDEYRLILNLLQAPDNVTLRADDVALIRNYTPADTVTRTDNFVILNGAGGDYTFTGENQLLISFDPIPGSGSLIEGVPAVINSSGTVEELNNATISIPEAGFEDVEIPDTTALAGFEFRTARVDHYLSHADLARAIQDNAIQWFYGKARLRTVSTTHAVSEAVDLASGSTLNGAPITGIGNLVPNVVYQSTGTGTGAGELVASVILPVDYTNYDLIHITEMAAGVPNEWRHTIITTQLLNSGNVASNDYLRVQGNTDLSWTSGTRTLSSIGATQSIYSVILIDV